jgi:hypothetical protein
LGSGSGTVGDIETLNDSVYVAGGGFTYAGGLRSSGFGAWHGRATVRPCLTIGRSGADLSVCLPLSSGNTVLEFTSDLGSPDWQPAGGVTSNKNGQSFRVIAPAGEIGSFRVSAP